MCAILDGFSKYIAIDIIEHFNVDKNLKVLLEFQRYFNKDLIFAKLLQEVRQGKRNLINFYKNLDFLEDVSVDLIISNAVLEHVLDLEKYYKEMFRILKPNGFCSHVIDYGAHEFSEIWYEHLYLSNWFWSFLMHGRMYPINRFSHSYHIKIAKDIGFKVIYEKKNLSTKADINKLSKNLRKIYSDEDLQVKNAHIILKKEK